MSNNNFSVQLLVGDRTLLTSYSDSAPFIPRTSDKIVHGLDKFRVLEVLIMYKFPSGMDAVVHLERI